MKMKFSPNSKSHFIECFLVARLYVYNTKVCKSLKIYNTGNKSLLLDMFIQIRGYDNDMSNCNDVTQISDNENDVEARAPCGQKKHIRRGGRCYYADKFD